MSEPATRYWPSERQAALLDYVREHPGLTAPEIADACGLYPAWNRVDRCFDDLKRLARLTLVERSAGRPARWSAAR